MFKKCKEIHCLNQEMLQFISRQLIVLKQIALKCKETPSNLISDSIFDCINLIEKKVLFALDKKSENQFHDYLTDFYEQKINKLKSELSKSIQTTESLQNEIKQIKTVMKQKQDNFIKNKSVDINNIGETFDLKKKLNHSEQILKENQQFMKEQNEIIAELQAYVLKVQDRQSKTRKHYEQKILNFDVLISNHHSNFQKMMKEFDQQRKKMDKDMKQVQFLNVSLMEDKQRSQKQMLIKYDELKLLSKKIFDQGLIISRLERQVSQTEQIRIQEKSEYQRMQSEYGKFMEVKQIQDRQIERLKIQNQKLTYEYENQKEISNKLKRDLNQFNELSEMNEEKTNIFNKKNQEKCQLLKIQLQELELSNQKLVKQSKINEKKQKQLMQIASQLEQTQKDLINNLNKQREFIIQLKQQNLLLRSKFQKQKLEIKEDISTQFTNLIRQNDEILKNIKKLEISLKESQLDKESLEKQNSNLAETINRLTEAFQSSKTIISKMEAEKYEQQQCISSNKKKYAQLEKTHRELIQQTLRKQDAIQEGNKIKAQHTSLIQKFESQSKQLATTKLQYKGLSEQNQSKEKQETKQLKEEAFKKDFQIKQLTNKIQILQSELREADKISESEKQRMTAKIKELQDIIQQRFELTNRLTESTVRQESMII